MGRQIHLLSPYKLNAMINALILSGFFFGGCISMLVLKTIGSFFVKIWRWIKETAWVQPLLIVGAIFAVIFSIPYITDWVSSWGYGSTGAFFNSKKYTLEGEVTDISGEDSYKTKADEITENIYENTMKAYAKEANIDTSVYGDKFFLVYTSSDCDSCDKAESGFKYLSEKWNVNYFASDNRSFNLYTIFTDETSSNDSDYEETPNDKTAFHRYLGNHLDFFNNTSTHLEEAPYKNNQGVGDDNYKYYQQPDFTNFSTPTILLVDYSNEAIEQGRGGVCEVLFGLSGETDSDRADKLIDMWNHLDTNDTTNPFTKNYRA